MKVLILRPAWSGDRPVVPTEIPVEGIILRGVVIEVCAQKIGVEVEHFQYRRGESRVESINVKLINPKGRWIVVPSFDELSNFYIPRHEGAAESVPSFSFSNALEWVTV